MFKGFDWHFFKRKSFFKPLDLSLEGKRKPLWRTLLILLPALIVISFFTIYPFVYSFDKSFQINPDRYDKTTFIYDIGNYQTLFSDPFFIKGIKNSMIYAFISIPLIMTISIMVSSAIAGVVRKFSKGFWQTVFFLPYVTSGVAIALAFAYFFDIDTGLLNKIIGKRVPWLIDTAESSSALKAMLIYGVWRGLAFNILIFTTAMLGVDKTLYKSAAIDGAGPFKQFFSITLPAIKRTTNFLLTVGIIGAMKVFPLALFRNNASDAMNHGGSTLMLYVYNAIQGGQGGRGAAASIILVVIGISFSVVFKGLINQTVKGFNYLGEKHVKNKIRY